MPFNLPLNRTSPFDGFSKLSRKERLMCLLKAGLLTTDDLLFLGHSVADNMTTAAEQFIEDAIGCFPLPLSITPHFHIDGEDYLIPMTVEESSIIAAASHTAKWIRKDGEITTQCIGSSILGQLHIPLVKHFSCCQMLINSLAHLRKPPLGDPCKSMNWAGLARQN